MASCRRRNTFFALDSYHPRRFLFSQRFLCETTSQPVRAVWILGATRQFRRAHGCFHLSKDYLTYVVAGVDRSSFWCRLRRHQRCCHGSCFRLPCASCCCVRGREQRCTTPPARNAFLWQHQARRSDSHHLPPCSCTRLLRLGFSWFTLCTVRRPHFLPIPR